MIQKFLILLICVLINLIQTRSQNVETNHILPNNLNLKEKSTSTDASATTNRTNVDLVSIQLYYESLCPDCRVFDSKKFKQTVIELGSYLDIHLYPYGNARTVDNGGGKYMFICQHGPAECYGNKLHACAIDVLQNITAAVLFNSCLMDESQEGKGSNDAAADVCGKSMDMDFNAIKECAKGARGIELLKMYGDESKKEGFKSVPHIRVNGALSTDEHFKDDVCKAFKNPPSGCRIQKTTDFILQ